MVLKAFSDVVKARISIVRAMCVYMSLYTHVYRHESVYTDLHLPGKPYVENGSVYVRYLLLCHPSTVMGRDPLRVGWRDI